ncbi:MAG: hypothetical protein WCA07_14570 [Gloeobacterales cyanobacterium]
MVNFAAIAQTPEPAVLSVDLDFKQFFVSLIESAYREGRSLEEIYSDIAKLKTELVIPDLDSFPLKEWALQTYWAMEKRGPQNETSVVVCGLCGKIAPERELNCAKFCPYSA